MKADIKLTHRLLGIVKIVLTSPFSCQCQNHCWLSIACIHTNWKVAMTSNICISKVCASLKTAAQVHGGSSQHELRGCCGPQQTHFRLPPSGYGHPPQEQKEWPKRRQGGQAGTSSSKSFFEVGSSWCLQIPNPQTAQFSPGLFFAQFLGGILRLVAFISLSFPQNFEFIRKNPWVCF